MRLPSRRGTAPDGSRSRAGPFVRASSGRCGATDRRRSSAGRPARLAAAGIAVWVVVIAPAAHAIKPPARPVAAARSAASDVLVNAADLPRAALSEFAFIQDAEAAGGRRVGTPNHGDELDPPPENDPHVAFKVRVVPNVAYRCWVRMKVGTAQGKSEANLVFVQFSDASVAGGKDALAPGTRSYLSARGPGRPGWAWVPCELAGAPGARVQFRAAEPTVRIQAGMEGVAFDQVLLSPARHRERAPAGILTPE